ncbi:COG4223 family protein [Oceanicola sp. 22II-s10i]|uniref:COG4223 family protein n=1 Tax=Oceanicola sp. 22II-s10i TaxID=1317116 RepID=UPI000B524494|nr:hypothetical protein [Oceanicola sp. 22II-s10i]
MADKKKSSEPEKDQVESSATDAETLTDADDTLGTGPDEPADETIVVEGTDTVAGAEDSDTLAAAEAEDEVVTPEPGTEPDTADQAEDKPADFEDAEVVAPGHTTEADPEPREKPVTSDAAPPPPPPAKSGGGFLPGFFGGLIAAAVIMAAGFYWQGQQDNSDQIDAVNAKLTQQGTQIAELSDAVAAGPDLAPVTARVDDVASRVDTLGTRIDEVANSQSGLMDRITEIEKRPITESVSPDAIRAYEQELERLKQAMADQRREVEALIDQARQMEDDASATAEATLRRAALTRILSALDNGSPYSGALNDLREAGQDVPEALARNAESGVASMSQLRDGFPEAARLALATARAEGNGGGNFFDFLRDQLGARSLEPREGGDADAILSRAEAALKSGRLGDALAELDSLSDGAKAEMSDWIDTATTRHEAVKAAEDLSAALNAG